MQHNQIIISPSEIAAGIRGSGLGPYALRTACRQNNIGFFDKMPVHHMPHLNHSAPHHTSFHFARHIDLVAYLLKQIHRQSCGIFQNADRVYLFSGDHSNAAGLISGFCRANAEKKTGVIWIDAHADLHTPYTSPSGNIHGMPLGALLQAQNEKMHVNTISQTEKYAWEEICALNTLNGQCLLKPENLVFVDLRDYEKEEEAILKTQGIRYFTPEDRKKNGLESILQQALTHLSNCDVIYVSFDVDSLDASLVPGTGTPVENGMQVKDAAYILTELHKDSRVKAIEITEINPLLDIQNGVGNLVADLIRNWPSH